MSDVSRTVLPELYSPTTPTRHSVVLTRRMPMTDTPDGPGGRLPGRRRRAEAVPRGGAAAAEPVGRSAGPGAGAGRAAHGRARARRLGVRVQLERPAGRCVPLPDAVAAWPDRTLPALR